MCLKFGHLPLVLNNICIQNDTQLCFFGGGSHILWFCLFCKGKFFWLEEKKMFKLSHNAFWWNLRKRSISNISVKRLTESHTKHAAQFLLWVANTLPRTLHADKGNFPCVLQFLLAKNFIFLQQCLSIICPSMSCFADGVVIVCRCLIAQQSKAEIPIRQARFN